MALPNVNVNVQNQNLGVLPESVSGVKSFIGIAYRVPGKHDGGAAAAILSDASADFLNKGVLVGQRVFNITDGSSALITAVTKTTITGVLTGGTTDDWNTTDYYDVFSDFATIQSLVDIKNLVGLGPQADDLINYLNAGGRKAIARTHIPTTDPVASARVYERVASSTGTVVAAANGDGKIVNKFNVRVKVTKTGAAGVGKWQFSTDDGKNFGPIILMTATYIIPNTGILITLTGSFDKDDNFTFTTTEPAIIAGTVTAAVTALIDSNKKFDAIYIGTPDAGDGALASSVKTLLDAALLAPNFRFTSAFLRGPIQATGAAAVTTYTTLMGAIANDRVQIISGQLVLRRANHGDQIDRSVLGILAGRRAGLGIAEDVGLFEAGQLPDTVELPLNWTDGNIDDLDGLLTATIRQFKGVAGFYPTNGPMSDPNSDVTKDARRLVLDKASDQSRLAGLKSLKTKVDPNDVNGSLIRFKSDVKGALDVMEGNFEISDSTVDVPAGQDILSTETLLLDIGVIPFGHASFINITIGFQNPFQQTA